MVYLLVCLVVFDCELIVAWLYIMGILWGIPYDAFLGRFGLVSVRGWEDYQAGVPLALFESPGLMQNLRFSSPSLLLTLGSVSKLQFIVSFWHFPSVEHSSCSEYLSVHCSKLQCWVSLCILFREWETGGLDLGIILSTSRESSNKPKCFI